MRLKLTVEYDGTPFRGWAAQPGLPTVEGVLRDALAQTFDRYDDLAVAGRTDTGVHALANVVSVDVEGGPPARAHRRSRSTRAFRTRSPSRAPRRRRPTSTRGSALAPAATAIASTRGGRRRPSSSTAAGGIRGRSTKTHSPPPPRCCRASTTSGHSRRRRPSTRSSRAPSKRRAGCAPATTSISRSPPTASSATWCARSSGRWSSAAPSKALLDGGPAQLGRRHRAAARALSGFSRVLTEHSIGIELALN